MACEHLNINFGYRINPYAATINVKTFEVKDFALNT